MHISPKISTTTLLDRASMAVILSDKELRPLYISPSTYQLFECDQTDIFNKSLTDSLQISSEQLLAIQNLNADSLPLPMNILYPFSSEESGEFTLQVQCLESEEGEPVLFFEVSTDCGPHMSPTDLMKLGSQISTISHDLSNPIAVLKLQCDTFEMMANKTETVDSQNVLKKLNTFKKATEKLTDSIAELKVWAKLLTQESIDLVIDRLREQSSENPDT